MSYDDLRLLLIGIILGGVSIAVVAAIYALV